MTLKLSEMEKDAKQKEHFCLQFNVPPEQMVGCEYVPGQLALISWAKRARAYLQKELPHVKSSLERFESTLGHNKVAQETVIPRLKRDIAELEQLLGEVEE